MHQIAVVNVALCLTLLLAGVPLLVQLCVHWNTYYFSFLVNGKEYFSPIVCIQSAQNETGNSKMPPKSGKNCPPPPLGPLGHATGVGVRN